MPDDILDVVFDQIGTRITKNRRQLENLTAKSERSGGTFSGRIYTLANAPIGADGMITFAFAFISDGLKPGETSGNGTGVFAMYNPDTDEWLRTSDYSAVTT